MGKEVLWTNYELSTLAKLVDMIRKMYPNMKNINVPIGADPYSIAPGGWIDLLAIVQEYTKELLPTEKLPVRQKPA